LTDCWVVFGPERSSAQMTPAVPWSAAVDRFSSRIFPDDLPST